MPVRVEVVGRSDVGCVRERNEDSFLIADLTCARRGLVPEVASHECGAKGSLFIVCDGMGGAAAGDVASSLAVEVMFQEMLAAPPSGSDRAMAARLLRRAVRTANRRLVETAHADPMCTGMGTTLSAAVVWRQTLLIAQVGDSRAYVARGPAFLQVTRDQSIAAALIGAGTLTPEEAESFAYSNVILQALGVADDVEVSISVVDLRRGDRLLLCSDGLHAHVEEATIREALGKSSLSAACDDLIASAIAAGAPDNVTAILVAFSGEDLTEPQGPDDLPVFAELDPAEEGAKALANTSRIAHRLAARAGVGESDGTPEPLPPTGMYRQVPVAPEVEASVPKRQSGIAPWLVLALTALVVVAILLGQHLR